VKWTDTQIWKELEKKQAEKQEALDEPAGDLPVGREKDSRVLS